MKVGDRECVGGNESELRLFFKPCILTLLLIYWLESSSVIIIGKDNSGCLQIRCFL